MLLERFWINLSPSVYARKKNTKSKSSRATMFNFGSKVRFYFQRAKITIRHDSRTRIFFLVGQQVMFVVCSLFSTIFVQRSKRVEKDFHPSSCFILHKRARKRIPSMDWTKSDFFTQRKENVYFETKAEYVFFSNLRGKIKYCLLLERF